MTLPPLRPVIEDAETRREAIRKKATEGLTNAFPVQAGKHLLEISNIRIEPRDYSSHDQKRALLEGKTLSERVRGDVIVKNTAGAITDHAKDFTLLQLPYFTPRHTFILDGTEYSVSNQLRQKPGVYVRKRGNEELEATFNLSKGSNFRMSMDSEKGLLYMQPSHTTSKIPLHPVLRALGVPHQDIAQHWGSELAGMNRDAWKSPDKHVDKLYETLVHPAKQTAATPEEKARVLRDYFHNTAMDPEVNHHTLGHAYDKATPAAILAASKKLLDVHRNAADVDDRDSLAFKTFHSVDDFIKERIELDARAMRAKLGWKLDAAGGKLRKAMPAGPFTRSMQNLMVGSTLSAVPMQINPMELLDGASRVTMLGEGGIASDRAIPLEARDVHPTHFGILDPARTPESFKAGVDLRAAIGAHRDNHGNLYAPVHDIRTNKSTYLKAGDMAKAVIAFPGEPLGAGKMVDAMKAGVVTRVPSNTITHQLTHTSDQYGPTSNLLPFLYGIQGNRVLMASKHQGHALPLVHREAPLVQSASWNPGKSVEQEMAAQIVPTARVAGTISKIDDHWIHIQPHTKTSASEKFAVVLMHVGGPSGSGKTTLLNKMRAEHPGLIVEDLDKFDDDATAELYPSVRKHDYTADMLKTLAERRQSLMDGFLTQHKDLPVLLGGHHTEDEHVLDIPTDARRMLDTPLRTSVWRAYRRSQNEAPDHRRLVGDFSNDYREARDTEKQLLGLGYTPASLEAIEREIGDRLHTPAHKTASTVAGTKLHYDTHFPLAAKTMLHNTLLVKEGDVVKPGQLLAASNFTKGGTLALGTNLKVSYMPYRGLNTNDGIVVSRSAADKLVSEHVYQHALSREGGVQLRKDKHQAYFGSRYTAAQYAKLDEDGVVKPGTTLHKGDIIAAGVHENKATGDALLLGKLSKSLVKPYGESVELWNHDHPGHVLDIAKTPNHVAASIRTHETLQIGDKLANRFGNKGVIAKIVPDNQMIHDEHGKPIDLLFSSAGIVSRINPAQVIETALGKVAEKMGKPLVMPQYAHGRDNIQYAKDLLKEHGLSDKETVTDPITGKKIPNVVVGQSYILKLFKTTDSNWSAHGAEKYDFNQQPSRGGDEGAKGIGRMEFDGLVAHNARNVLREAASIKSQRNDEFWRAVQLGLPTPAPKSPFAYDKLHQMLAGAGVKVSKAGSRLSLGPLTDKDVMSMSSGALSDPSKTIRAKDLRPETHGLFDPAKTGGMSGTKWSHVDLHEPIVNPVFEEPVRRLLGLTQKDFMAKVGQGGRWFKSALEDIDPEAKRKELVAQTKKARGPVLDGLVKQIKYLDGLKAQDLKPHDAYVMSKVPVMPPIIRPILPLKDGTLQVGDANLLYKDAFLANHALKQTISTLPKDEHGAPRQHLYNAVSALYGVGDPVSPTAEKRGAKGYLAAITGTRPGSGFFQSKIMKRQQDVSGRGTIAPDPTLSMDEIGIPEGMMWNMYGKFVIGRLVRRGYSAIDAQKMLDNKNPIAREELLHESRERPVIVNRAPSLHRFNVVGAYPKMIDGKTIRLNPFAEKGMNADYDGDALQVHAPVTPGGIEDVKKMTLSSMIFADKRPGVLNIAPDMEAVIGLHRATQASSNKKTKYFHSQEEAMAAYHKGEIALNDPIEIKK